MTEDERNAIADLAGVLAAVCSKATIADLLNATLGIDANERLTDRQVELGQHLFDRLCDLRPDCVEIARER